MAPFKPFLRVLFICSLVLFTTVGNAQAHITADTSSELKSSGVSHITCDSATVRTLTKLGMLWGFIKYYHAGVNRGNFEMDAELFRVLPLVLAPGIDPDRVMEEWVDHFGVPGKCEKCPPIDDTANAMLMPDYGYLFDQGWFPRSLITKLDHIRKNRLNRSDLQYVTTGAGVGNPVFTNELPYEGQIYPDAGMRLLALYRFWNMVQYFHPSRHLTRGSWNQALADLVPEFCRARDTLAYYHACVHMIARIRDGHARLTEPKPIRRLQGTNMPAFRFMFAEDKLVITIVKDTLDLAQKLKRGDVIAMINGVSVDTLIQRYRHLAVTSNATEDLYHIAGDPLFRSNDTLLRMEIIRGGKQLSVVVPLFDPMNISHDYYKSPETGYKMVRSDIGYIYPAKLNGDDLSAVKHLMRNAKGIIVDLRCYPNTFMPFTYCNWLKKGESPFVQFSQIDLRLPGRIKRAATVRNGCASSDCYEGKVVVIVNYTTASQAEYTTMALAGPNTIVIGDTTAGADGNISPITLPGNIKTRISGLGVYYPDGTQTQQVGVKIDKIVRPTIEGIRQGKDEQLETAINYIK